ncbi:exported protein [Leptospira kobayashii]|uniref:Exported protein n=1 Tax=Leptospira kobayashii TaxID=1917830 RepID=A0ABM7UQT9_9LEPT|nr:alpha/beta fold hydrolase [Leptospira kobayashii]BDA77950.1 exported protein [Leptospira kobayashii]
MHLTKRALGLTTIIFVILLLSAGYYFSTEMVAFQVRTIDEDHEKSRIKDFKQIGLSEPETLRFQNGTISIQSWFFKNPKKKKCGVILLHGHSGTRWGILKYAPLFWKRGCSLFVYDARHHGESSGEFGTFGYYEKFDLDKGIEYFSEVSGIPEEKIGALGESYGAATVLQLANIRKDVAFIIAESSYKDMRTIIQKRAIELYGYPILIVSSVAFQIAELRANFSVEETSPLKAASHISAPVLLIHSKADELTPYEHSVEIFEAIPGKKKKLFITEWGAPHAKSINTNYKEVENSVDAFVKEYAPAEFR